MMTAFRCISALLLGLLWPTAFLPAQSGASDPGRLRSVARELMIAARYAALITVDSTGATQARTIDPFAPDEAMVVWFAKVVSRFTCRSLNAPGVLRTTTTLPMMCPSRSMGTERTAL